MFTISIIIAIGASLLAIVYGLVLISIILRKACLQQENG